MYFSPSLYPDGDQKFFRTLEICGFKHILLVLVLIITLFEGQIALSLTKAAHFKLVVKLLQILDLVIEDVYFFFYDLCLRLATQFFYVTLVSVEAFIANLNTFFLLL